MRIIIILYLIALLEMKYLIFHLGPQLPSEFCGDDLGWGLDFIQIAGMG